MNEETLFELVLNTPEADRAALLDRECAGNPGLRQRVEALLAAHVAPDIFVDPNALGDVNKTGAYAGPRATAATAGTIIAGKYKLLQQIGEGGMGTVWMADQTEPVKRRVAVKLIHAERGSSKTILSRFEAERQAIALMDHPHIAKLLDAGTTEPEALATDGRTVANASGSVPFFVMELVKGVPLTDFCDAHKLSIPQRLNLFMQICSAVQHAHQKGIIHRDLKPSNILVESHDGKPVPKVIDFGLAKATSGLQLTEHTLFTGFGTVMGTPLYMSPEQAAFNAVDVDTRADVYALGVILYELLTGTTPLTRESVKKAALDEMLKLIREQEAPTPSSRLSSSESKPAVAANRQTEPLKLGRFVKGELDWIVMKALSKERDRRYETANGFAKDIERFLNHEPVLAGPPSASYKLRKFVRRNRGQVVAASLVLFTLLAGLTTASYGFYRADIQRQRAEGAEKSALANALAALDAADEERQAKLREAEQRTKAEKARDRTRDVLDAMTSSATGDSLSGQSEISDDQKKFLTEVLTYYRQFAGEKADDQQTRARTASAAFRVGRIEQRLGRKEHGISAFQIARDGYRTLAADFPSAPGFRRELAGCFRNLALLLDDTGNRAEAEAHYRQALAMFEKLAADFPTVGEYRRELAYCYGGVGDQLKAKGRGAEAELQYNVALTIQEKLAVDFPNVPDFRRGIAITHNAIGSLLMGLGKRTDAEGQYRKSLAVIEKLAADFPAEREYRQHLATSHSSLADLLAELEKRTEAEQHYLSGLSIREKLVADFPAVPAYLQELSRSHNNFGHLLSGLGKRAEAEERYRKALAIHEKLAANFPAVPAYLAELAMCHNNLGLLLANSRKQADAEEQFRKAVTIGEKLVVNFSYEPAYRQTLAHSHNNFGSLLQYGLGKRTEAEEQYLKALGIRERLVTDFPTKASHQIDLGGSYCNHGNLFLDSGRASESLGWFDNAIATLAPVHRADPRDIAAKKFLRNGHWSRARAFGALMKHGEAVKEWDSAIELSPPAEQLGLRASRATSRLQAGLVAEAVAEAAELTKPVADASGSVKWNAIQWYDFGRVYAVASAKIADKKQEFADRAMELLQKAVKAGYKDAAHVAKDTDLDPLRGREDFKKLLAELDAAKANEKKPTGPK